MPRMCSRPGLLVPRGAPPDPSQIWERTSVGIHPATTNGNVDVSDIFSTDIRVDRMPSLGMQG